MAPSRDAPGPFGSLDLGAASALAVAARALVAGGIVDDALTLLDRLVRVLNLAHEAEAEALRANTCRR